MKPWHAAAFIGIVTISACGESRYEWAFAQDLDGAILENEVCRRSLAESIYDDANREKTRREGGSNIFVFSGVIQSYRIHAFDTQTECETALTALVTRRSSNSR